ENTWRLHMLVRTWSRDSSEIFKRNPTKTWHYILAQATPRPQQNQWVMSRTKARTVEDGLNMMFVHPAPGARSVGAGSMGVGSGGSCSSKRALSRSALAFSCSVAAGSENTAARPRNFR